MTLSRDAVLSALFNSDLSEENLYEDYLGRAMYGDTCFGLQVDSEREATRFLIALARSDDGHMADELVGAMRTDQLGLGLIVYFPGYTLEEAS